MAGRLPDTRRIRVVAARRGEFGDLDGERESLETKDGERESLETKDGDRDSLETKDGERENLETKDGDRERMETSRARQECRVQKRIMELHRTLDSPVNFGPGEEGPHLGSGAACQKHHGNKRDGSSGRSIDWKRYVKDKWVNQEARTLDPEWRDPAGHAQKGINGSRRPQSAGSWIYRSRGVKPLRSVKVPSGQSVKQVIYDGGTTKRVVGSSAVGSTQGARSPRRDIRDWDIRNLRIETKVAEFRKASRG